MTKHLSWDVKISQSPGLAVNTTAIRYSRSQAKLPKSKRRPHTAPTPRLPSIQKNLPISFSHGKPITETPILESSEEPTQLSPTHFVPVVPDSLEQHTSNVLLNFPWQWAKAKCSSCECTCLCFFNLFAHYLPFLRIFTEYRWKSYFMQDLFTGATVCVMHIPQACCDSIFYSQCRYLCMYTLIILYIQNY